METVIQDVRFGLRLLRKTPGFTAVAVLVLGLGIGANTAMFGLINAFLLRPLPGRERGPVYGLYGRGQARPDDWRGFSYANYRDLREPGQPFSALAAHAVTMVGIREAAATRRSLALMVSANYFEALGVQVERGRGFGADEERPGSALRVVVVSDAYWQRHGRDPGLLGKTVVVNSQPLTIVGIAPPGFSGTSALLAPDLWLPLGLYDAMSGNLDRHATPPRLDDPANHDLMLMGQLRPGITREGASAQLAALFQSLRSSDPAAGKDLALELSPLSRLSISTAPQSDAMLTAPALLLLAMAGVVLLIACLNLANMLLARGEARRKEIAIRIAIGGGRLRILRQLLTEALTLSLLGGLVGLALAYWATGALMASVAPLMPMTLMFDPRPDVRVLAATIAFSVAGANLAALVPAFRATRSDPLQDLRGHAGETRGGNRRGPFAARNLLVVGQIALSLVLVSAAGLFIQGARRAAEAGPGFALEGGVMAELDAGLASYDEAQGRAAFVQLLERLRRLPGVASASAASIVPFGMVTNSHRVARPEAGQEEASAVYTVVASDYFRTLGLPLLRGREFTPADDVAGASVTSVIIDEPLARRLWPDADAIGQTLVDSSAGQPQTYHVVGVAPGIRQSMFDQAPVPHVYVPLGPRYQSNLTFHLRATTATPQAEAALVEAVRRELQAFDPNLPVLELRTLRAHRDASVLLWAVRTGARLFSGFGALALVLAVVGVYGVKSYLVAQRTREIGIRMALGATPQSVRGLILREGMRLSAVGLLIGLGLSALSARALSGLLYQVSAADPATFTLAPLLLGLATLLACDLPARRATKVAPCSALRHD